MEYDKSEKYTQSYFSSMETIKVSSVSQSVSYILRIYHFKMNFNKSQRRPTADVGLCFYHPYGN